MIKIYRFPFHGISALHRLIVHDDPEDGFDIEHPPGCVAETGEWGSGLAYVSYDCDVAWHLDGVGIDYTYRHAFDDPDVDFGRREPLLPGVYTCWVETVKYQCWDCLGGYEYDSTLWVEPQRALESSAPRWYVATCLDCDLIPVPLRFLTAFARNTWADLHLPGQGHQVQLREEWRHINVVVPNSGLIIAGGWCTPNEQTEREFKQERENQLRTHWYLAVCVDCPQTQPFRNEIQREEWADGHATTGHRIELREVWA